MTTFPSLDIAPEYAIHDRDHFLEFVLALWFHTRELRGVPTKEEVALTLSDWPSERRAQLVEKLARHGQVA